CLSPEAYQKYISDISEDAIIVLDGDLDKGALDRSGVYRLPITEIARDQLGKEVVANVVALGAINGIAGILSDEAVYESLARSFPEKILDVNRQAYQLGFQAGKAAIE
ncbi:MAG: 2-oxoacid:acceptor oxidoreductase family protein, partial [Clostridiales bacterium]|nr:2-oxoacid:acceptor oxidoreductase family protein [Clostridiales bacterium]